MKYQNFVFLKKKLSRWQTRKNFSDERDISHGLDFFMASTELCKALTTYIDRHSYIKHLPRTSRDSYVKHLPRTSRDTIM